MFVLAEQQFWAYVSAAYVVVFLTVAVYAARTVVRGRKLAHRLPPDQRRWM